MAYASLKEARVKLQRAQLTVHQLVKIVSAVAEKNVMALEKALSFEQSIQQFVDTDCHSAFAIRTNC